jgi:membrane-bound serine protease (ClpP class)
MVLIILELFLPTMGILAVAGVISFVLGSLLLFNESSGVAIRRSVIFASTVVLGGAILLVSYLIYRAHRNKVKTGYEGLLGEVGEAISKITTSGGKVFVHGEYWNAVADEPIKKGEKVVVKEIKGMNLIVKKYQEEKNE